MGSSFVLKLALTNIKNHRKFYVPYILASIGTMMVFYIMSFLATNNGLNEMAGRENLKFVMVLGLIVIGLFSVIFLFYTNSFIIKRRKKEIGLYNILGMEKKHISKIIAMESLIVSVFSLIAGLGCGVLFSKLAYLLLAKLISFDQPIVFSISWIGLGVTAILFAVIFFASLLTNLVSIRLAKPIELLQGGNVGEKEPKTKLVLAIIGAISLGLGYYIAITTESPLEAIFLFFIAVVLVIIGTYCLFTAGSIALLKALKSNKKFYYKSKNFTAVSGMLYRMKQNAVGLANICILSTMVLIMISTTVSLAAGMQDILDTRFAGDVVMSKTYYSVEEADNSNLYDIANRVCVEEGVTMSDVEDYTSLSLVLTREGDSFDYNREDPARVSDAGGANIVCMITADQYENVTGVHEDLKANEALIFQKGKELADDFQVLGHDFTTKKQVERFIAPESMEAYMADTYYVVVSDNDVLREIYASFEQLSGGEQAEFEGNLAFDLDEDDEKTIEIYHKIDQEITNNNHDNYEFYWSECKQIVQQDYYGMVGGFLFLGIFLGLVFTFAAALIIYYKQISEGYYDKDKFEIMQKVGMSKQEVKKSIRTQVLMVFFIPLIMAGIHVLAAFKLITRLLLLFSLTNVGLFATCTVITFLIFAGIYAAVYAVTAREYYKIVQQ